jgi:hypothetical protein
MKLVRRKRVAWLCMSALLFLQLAVAAYACPMPMDGSTSAMAAATTAEAQPCPMTDQERSKLCEQHCIQASQSVDTQPHSAVYPPVLPLLGVVAWPDVPLATGSKSQRAFVVTGVDPPPLVRFGVLRI